MLAVLAVGLTATGLTYLGVDDARRNAADRAFQRLAERTADLAEQSLILPRYGLGGARGGAGGR